MDPFIGEIRMVPFNFAPQGWALCDGQLLAVNQNAALFSLLGTTYGGDGTKTFALPDFRGRVPINQGQGPGLPSYEMGQQVNAQGTTNPTTGKAGANAPVSMVCVNFIIALNGIFPSRS
jgi:microcystin-dependent protein